VAFWAVTRRRSEGGQADIGTGRRNRIRCWLLPAGCPPAPL